MDENPPRNRVLTGFDPPLEIESGERSVDKGNISQQQDFEHKCDQEVKNVARAYMLDMFLFRTESSASMLPMHGLFVASMPPPQRSQLAESPNVQWGSFTG